MFAVLGLGEALARLLAFTATIVVARRLGADVYGVLAVATAVVLYCSHVADFSVEVIGARELAQGSHGGVDELVPPLVAARLALAAGCVIVLSAIGFLFLPQPDGAILASCSLTLLAVASSTRWVFLGIERPLPVAVVRVTCELVVLALVVFLARDPGDIGQVPVARVAGDGLAAVLLVLLLRRRGFRLPVRRAPDVVRPVLSRAAPLVAHAILGLVIFNSDLIFLRAMRDARTAGQYAAAYTVVSFLLNLGVTYGNSLLPVLSRLASEPARQKELYANAMVQVLVVALPVAAGGWFLAGDLIALMFGSAYVAAAPALQILIWSIVVAYIRTVGTFALIANHRQGFVLRTTIWSAGINLVLNAILIPRFGMAGAAAATLATETVRTVIGLAYGRSLGLAFEWLPRLWRPVVATLAMMLVLWMVKVPQALLAVGMGAVVFAAVLAMTGGLRFRGGLVLSA